MPWGRGSWTFARPNESITDGPSGWGQEQEGPMDWKATREWAGVVGTWVGVVVAILTALHWV